MTTTTGAPAAATPATGGLLTVEHLSTSFRTPAGLVQAVRDVSFTVAPGEVVGLVGESGSGKTVTALSLLRLLPAAAVTSGRVCYQGRDLGTLTPSQLRRLRGRDISMIFQDPMTSLDPLFTIGAQVAGVLRAHSGISRADAAGRAAELLRLVGISDVTTRLRQYPHQLSGGMRQRVLIAMALANDPGLLIADEPTTALDVTIQAQIIRLLRQVSERTGMSVILVTHDLGVVAGVCDRVLVMYGGRLVESGPAAAIYGSPRHPYTTGLLGSVIRPDCDRSARLVAIDGYPPAMLNPPPGCPFAPRCPHATGQCHQELPALTPRAANHLAACFVTEASDASAV